MDCTNNACFQDLLLENFMFSVKQGDDLHIVFDKESLQLISLFAIAKSTVNSANILIQRP